MQEPNHTRDKRHFPRRAFETKAILTFEDGHSKEENLRDLSVTGIKVSSSDLGGCRTKDHITLSLPEFSPESTFTGQIAWTGNHAIGVAFNGNNSLQNHPWAPFILEKANDIKAFTFELTVYLKDTNAVGNTYFARYFEWQGMAREAFLKAIVENPLQMMQAGIKFITANASIDYHHETTLYDTVVIKVHAENMKRVSLDLIFNYYNKITSRLIARGRQKITFAGPTGRIVPIPEPLASALVEYTKGDSSAE